MNTPIQIKRICQCCGNEFLAFTTVTKYCSKQCNSKAYKANKRNERIESSNKEVGAVLSRAVEEIQVKEFLSISEVVILLGLSRRTVYRLIEKGELEFSKIGARTIIKRTAIDTLLSKKPITTKRNKEPITEFYSIMEVEEKYHVKYGALNNIIKKNKVPKKLHNGKLIISKQHIDKYFAKRIKDVSSIKEWYSVDEIREKYKITRDQVYSRVHDNGIPRKKEGKYVKISKIHFDKLFINVV